MSLRKQLLNLLFPPRCPFCNQPLHDAETGPCPTASRPLLDPRGPGRGPGQNFVRRACAGWYRGGLRDSPAPVQVLRPKGVCRHLWPHPGPGGADLPPRQLRCAHLGARLPPRRKERGYDQAQPLAQATAQALGTEAVSPAGQDGAQRPPVLPHPGQPAAVQRGGVYTVPSRRRWPADGCW